jgi:hypothetical protein
LEQQIQELQTQVAALQAKLTSIGRLVKTADSAQVYLLKAGTLYPIANELTLERLYSPTLVETVAQSDIAGLPQGPQINVQ